jgi:CubicO group peptidase (beta-lactamase class C family)
MIYIRLFLFCTLLFTLLNGLSVRHISGQKSNTFSSEKEVISGEYGAKFDELLSRYEMYGFSGTVLVVKNNQIVINKGYGLADLQNKKSNTVETLFDVGSIAKTFTAAAILQLEMRGKLKTDDLISKYLNESPPDKSSITIHQLLTHTAGFKLDAADVGSTPTDNRAEFLEKVKNAPLVSIPGVKYNYSNVGYALLANIIEKVTGQTWQAYLRKNLLKPAKLKQTIFWGENSKDFSLARGYLGASEEDLKLEEPLRQEREDSYSWRKYLLGSGGVITTTGDLYKWWQALRSKKILSENARRKMFTVQSGTQGFGWNIGVTENEITRIHRGGLRGSFQSLIAYYPKENAVLIYALNKKVGDGAPFWASVGWANLEKVVLGKDYVLPPKITSFSAEKLSSFGGEYELPSGEKFIVWIENNSLFVGAKGQSAVNLLAYPQNAPPNFQNELSEAGKQIVELLEKNDSVKIKATDYLSEKNLAALQTNWKEWTNKIGDLKSVEILGISPGATGFVRTFIKLEAAKSSVVIRLLWDWNNKKLLAWGDDIPLPAITKFSPESEMAFVNFDFNKSQTIRIKFRQSASGEIQGLVFPSNDEKDEITAGR